MGEIAEAMINGLFCESCGELIDGDEPGHPRKCVSCKPKSKNASVRGVKNFLLKRKIENYPNELNEYNKEILGLSPEAKELEICDEIQKNFGQFVNYINKKYPRANAKQTK